MGETATKATRKRRALTPTPRNPDAAKIEAAIMRLAKRRLAAIGKRVRARLTAKIAKSDDAAERLRSFLASLSADDLSWTDAEVQELRDLLEEVATASADGTINHIFRTANQPDDIDALLEQANERAIAWARDRASNLVTDVTDTTRKAINDMTASAIERGITTSEFAGELSDAYEFSDDRATLIGRTEIASAETAGTLEGYAASGVVEKKGWSADEEACDECEPLDGVEVTLDEDFPDDGGDGPPLHPACRCTVYPVVAGEAEE